MQRFFFPSVFMQSIDTLRQLYVVARRVENIAALPTVNQVP